MVYNDSSDVGEGEGVSELYRDYRRVAELKVEVVHPCLFLFLVDGIWYI